LGGNLSFFVRGCKFLTATNLLIVTPPPPPPFDRSQFLALNKPLISSAECIRQQVCGEDAVGPARTPVDGDTGDFLPTAPMFEQTTPASCTLQVIHVSFFCSLLATLSLLRF
jgi:hypothetical protein